MKDSRLTKAEAVELAYKAMDKYHDENYAYEPPVPDGACVYQDPKGQPSCLVGCILHEMGIPLREEWSAEDMPVDKVLDELRVEGVVDVEPDAHYFLAILQSLQDGRETWGNAIRTAARRP